MTWERKIKKTEKNRQKPKKLQYKYYLNPDSDYPGPVETLQQGTPMPELSVSYNRRQSQNGSTTVKFTHFESDTFWVKEFYINITQKNNKDIKTTFKGANITLDRTILSQLSSIPNEGPAITFGSTSRIILGDEAWKHSEDHRYKPYGEDHFCLSYQSSMRYHPLLVLTGNNVRREDFGHKRTKTHPTPEKVVAEED
ncbi:hypothetical protein M9H77_19486 [Catharanthus roseus]|uniref:Uncharacterized protein n=1 Tax=Catharanthus roseus TaxID=4058 RepID=A0ACC0BAH7_CATRO|nr:hypothetical protein M9H77_19486 [Catharanthus roseus]